MLFVSAIVVGFSSLVFFFLVGWGLPINFLTANVLSFETDVDNRKSPVPLYSPSELCPRSSKTESSRESSIIEF